MKPLAHTLLFLALTASPLALAAPASPPADGTPASRLSWEWNARLRHESVDDDAFVRDADATTLRLRLGARLRIADGWSAFVEGEGVAALDRDSYDSTANRRIGWPVIADPTGVELNQAYVAWKGSEAAATFGRQRINLDNQRWVGAVGWRQNEQAFDAASFEYRPAKSLTVRYAWLDRVHRVNGDDARDPLARERDLDTHLLDVSLAHGTQQFGGYAYAHEDRDVPAASTLTTGLRWTGNRVKDGRGYGWRAEAARQVDYGNNPLDFGHDYWLLEPSATLHGITWRAGWEHLGGNGRHALQTPLATLHAFNGWADKFTTTPAAGLEDRYLAAGGPLGTAGRAAKLKWVVAWHDYASDVGGIDYGREWDASLAFPVHGPVTGLVKLADYRADGFARDTTKLWVQVEWAHP